MEGLRLDVGSQRRRSGKIKAFPSSKIAFNITKDIMKIVRTNISECMLLLGNRRGGAFRGSGFFFLRIWPEYCLDFHVVLFHILSR